MKSLPEFCSPDPIYAVERRSLRLMWMNLRRIFLAWGGVYNIEWRATHRNLRLKADADRIRSHKVALAFD
jgi:hypothetical protein